jgi:hypothetical protein
MIKKTEQHMNGTAVTTTGKTTVVENTREPTETAPIEPTTIPENRGDAFVQNFIARTMTLAQHAGIDVVQASDPGHPQNAIYRELIGAALAMAESST